MKKRVLTALAAGLCCVASTFGQVPSYVPTNGLVGWWPFNGNANDESGNGNNGTPMNGVALTTDRFGSVNKAYNFDGLDNYIVTQNSNISGITSRTYSIWFNSFGSNLNQILVDEGGTVCGSGFAVLCTSSNKIRFDNSCSPKEFNQNYNLSNWHHVVIVFDNSLGVNLNAVNCYLNGVLVNNSQIIGSYSINTGNSVPLTIGKSRLSNDQYFKGDIDDIGIWDRALTQSEITSLYQGCNLNPTISPASASVSSSTNAQFTTPSVTGGTYQWQNNPLNNGWQNVPSNTTYFGGTTNTLSVNNVQLSNHQQPFRVIVSDGSCTDTSAVALIEIADTCVNTVNDTLYTTVTDTLIINTTLSLAPPNDQNTIKIYPNPASDHITIDNGNYAAMAGYSIQIKNNAGQQVFQSAINQAQFYVDLSSWTGNGLYFVHLFDPQGNTVTVRKIVLQ
jgi:hypothetical protein